MTVRADELGRPIEILLVEDSPTDADLTRHALSSGKVNNRLHVVEDGEQAIQFLRRERAYARAPRPDLILLDLNLPRKSGREVLQRFAPTPSSSRWWSSSSPLRRTNRT